MGMVARYQEETYCRLAIRGRAFAVERQGTMVRENPDGTPRCCDRERLFQNNKDPGGNPAPPGVVE